MKILIEKFCESSDLIKISYITRDGGVHIQQIMKTSEYNVKDTLEVLQGVIDMSKGRDIIDTLEQSIEDEMPIIEMPPAKLEPVSNIEVKKEEPKKERKRRTKEEIEAEKAAKKDYGTPIEPPSKPIEREIEKPAEKKEEGFLGDDGFSEIEDTVYGSVKGMEENDVIEDEGNTIVYEKNNEEIRQACFNLMSKLTGEVFWPKNPKFVDAAKKAVDEMINQKMIFFKNGVVTSKVVDLFTNLVKQAK